jgi:hypothetical protein
MSNTENPNVENPELENEDEGDTDLKVRTNLKAGLGELAFSTNQLFAYDASAYMLKLSGGSVISSKGQTY